MTENTMTTRFKGSGGDLIKKKIIFAPPEKDAIVKITDRKYEIIVENSEVVQNGDYVLVKGYLNKSITYNTTNKDQLLKLMGKESNKEEKKEENDESNKEEKKEESKKPKKGVQCESLVPPLDLIAVDGVVRHTTIWIPFEVLVYVEGAREEDKVNVESKTIKSLYKDDEVVEDELIVGILVHDVINIDVTVTKNN
ncbi:hypothetical protein [Paraclostridium bifermentans]|uniref:hypothetical protein n=1 Tax=Paraclostridium bifermentans TaxID=1490 RepID=UPI00359C94B5